jgi:DNA-directed RNA polymerase specialized sigma24 family protein
MPDPAIQARQKLWGRALADATRYALYLTRNKTRAEELAAEALAAALDARRSPWDPDGGRSLSQHVVYLVRQVLKAESAKKRVRDNPRNAAAVDEQMRRGAPRPDAAILERQRLDRGEERRLEVRAGLDAFACGVLDLFGEDLTPAEQAAKLGVDVRKIYEARRRIAERIRALPTEESGEGDGAADADLRDGDEEEPRDEHGDAEDEVST